MSRPPAAGDLRAWFRRHERRLSILYSVGLVGLGLVFSLPPVRNALLSQAGAVLALGERRWIQRIEKGEELLASGRIDETISYLEALDERFPARAGRHALEKGRERILHALGRSHQQAGNKRLALEAYRRAVIFDPRNFWNHFALARAALALDEPDEAQAHLEQVLRIHPSHLPSLHDLIALYYNSEDYPAVVAAYGRYLDGFQVHELSVEVAGTVGTAPVRVDGRYHTVRVWLPSPGGSTSESGSDTLTLTAGPYSVEVQRVELEGALRRGEVGKTLEEVRPPSGSSWSASGTLPDELESLSELAPGVPPWAPRTVLLRPGQVASPGDLPPDPAETLLGIDLPRPASDVASVSLDLRLLKPVDPQTWGMVEASHRNLLAFSALEDARGRSAFLEPASGVGEP